MPEPPLFGSAKPVGEQRGDNLEPFSRRMYLVFPIHVLKLPSFFDIFQS
jgi:hypothetical protein